MKTKLAVAVGILAFSVAPLCLASELVLKMNKIDEKGVGAEIGTLSVIDTPTGMVIKPNLKGLPPGEHGFHVHVNSSCAPGEKDGKMVAGLGAGGHYDPAATGMHVGPTGKGHLGDLPLLTVDKDGTATKPVTAPNIKVANLSGRSFVIHAGSDNYSDKPEALGGGGGRIACALADAQRPDRKHKQKESK
jgi:Cu-Zn family superoxide dismutase